MAAFAAHPDRESIGLCGNRTVTDHDFPGFVFMRDVTGKDRCHPVESAIGDRNARTAATLFSRLKDQPDRCGRRLLGQERRCPDQHCHVRAMATGMHDALVFGRIRRPRGLLARERVHVGTQGNRRTIRIFPIDVPDDGVADARIFVANPESLELSDDSLRRLGLLKRELRMLVEPAPEDQKPLTEPGIYQPEHLVDMLVSARIHINRLSQSRHEAYSRIYLLGVANQAGPCEPTDYREAQSR